MKTFRYAVNTNGLRKYSLPQIVELAGKLGLDGIEWGLPKVEEAGAAIREMAHLTTEAGLEVVGYINGPKLWKKDDMRCYADLVASVGGRSLRVAHPWIAWDYGESLRLRESWHDIFKLAHDALPDVVELSKKSGIRFVLELHSGALTASALAAARLFAGIDPRHVGAIYDPANTVIEGRMRPRCEVEVLGPYLAYVHAKNVVFVPSGKSHEHPIRRARWEHRLTHLPCGMVDYVEVFFALKTSGYRGWISMEEFFMEGNDTFEQLRDNLAFLRECERHAPSQVQEPYLAFNA